MIEVKFNQAYQIYNAGEKAYFSPHIAEAMSKAGICKILAPSKSEIVQKLVEHRSPATVVK